MNIMKTVFAACLVGGLMSFYYYTQQSANSLHSSDLSKKINLSLRQVADDLYRAAGDKTSRIPPVNLVSDTEYTMKFTQSLNYDTLPYVLQKAMSNYGLSFPYYVAVENCSGDSVLLGYNFLVLQNNQVPCLGRHQVKTCQVLRLKIEEEEQRSFLLPFGVLACAIGVLGFLKYSSPVNFIEKQKAAAPKQTQNKIGNTYYDAANLRLSFNGTSRQLTFRENKLFSYLAAHPNQILKREDIQEQVWQDEGLIVGRSLDVFISRLRKILKEDDTLKITNIHGVGYKLEVRTES